MTGKLHFLDVLGEDVGWIELGLTAVIVVAVVKCAWAAFVQKTAQVPEPAPRRSKAEVRTYKRSELSQFDGAKDLHGPILIGVEGKVFDMGQRGGEFYGPGGPYHCFAGKDATLALAKVSVDPQDLQQDTVTWRQPDISEIDADERAALTDWILKFEEKYDMVGDLVDG